MTNAPGRFIVFEGGEGSGKSTQVALLCERLSRLGESVVATREPGGSPLSEQIRSLILADAEVDMSAKCESLLFAAARAEHVAAKIRPALVRGDFVVCDRFADSSVAYQGSARGLGETVVRDVSDWAADGIAPDLTILLDIDPEVGLARAQDPNRLESESIAFHHKVRDSLLAQARADVQRHVVLAASATTSQIEDQVWAVICEQVFEGVDPLAGESL